VEQWDLIDLRGMFEVVPQDSYLFSDTRKNNIAYGLEELSDEELRKASAISAIDQDLRTLARGWDTAVGERGMTLSGGQKQRVAIARALACDKEILVLDDSLSAVDAETERRVLDAVLEERRGRTCVIVSHRVSALQRTDRVLVLDGGRVTEFGAPEELAAAGGFYAKTAALQQLSAPG
jgi:ABC-type multidrug transport system fused ATPase/permease subunit